MNSSRTDDIIPGFPDMTSGGLSERSAGRERYAIGPRRFCVMPTLGLWCALIASPASAQVTCPGSDPEALDCNANGTDDFCEIARTQCNVSLYSLLPLCAFAGPPERGNSCWGYVSPAGQEYALMGLTNQIAVVRITDPGNPVIVGSISHSNSTWGDVRAYGNYAYACNESGGGLDVIDLTNVDSGVVTLVQRFTGSGLNTIHSLDINPDSGHLYLAGSNLASGGVIGSLVAVSLANPAAPVIAGQWASANGARYTHEPHVISYTSGPYAGKEVAFCFNGAGGLRILDVTNKANMVPFGSDVTYPGISYCHQGWTDADRHYLYVNDELDDTRDPAPRTMIFDISNLAAPVLAGISTSSARSTDHNLYWKDGLIFQVTDKGGLRIFDTTEPLSPVEFAYFDTYPENDTFGFMGAWNNHPFFPSGTVIVSDRQRGLFVLDAGEALHGGLAFSYPDGLPGLVTSSGGTSLRVSVSGVGAASPQPGSAVLHVDRGGGYLSFPMAEVSPNEYEVAFPGAVCGQRVSYYVSAVTTGGRVRTDPCDAPASAHWVLSGSAFAPAVFQDTMETSTGWISVPPFSPSTSSWTRGNPNPTGAQPGDDHTPTGVNCLYTGQSTDVSGGTFSVISPTFDLSAGDSVVTYWRWYYERDESDDPGDGFLAEISNNNGTTWTTVEFLSPYAGDWEKVQFFVGNYVTPTNQMKLRFSATDTVIAEDSGDLIEAAIDDVEVARLACQPQDADIDQDGDVDLMDFAQLANCFTGEGACTCIPAGYDLAGQPECLGADIDLDGDVGPSDYLAFSPALNGPQVRR